MLHVLGMPRIDLALVSWPTHCAADQTQCAADHPTLPVSSINDVVNWSLPYEMIIVGVYSDTPHCAEPYACKSSDLRRNTHQRTTSTTEGFGSNPPYP